MDERRITIFADDLTGALDTGVKFAQCGLDVAVTWGGATQADVLVIDSETRNLSVGEAQSVIKNLAQTCNGIIYKKMDSTLRGPFAAETLTLAEYFRNAPVIICPAFPAAGRTVVESRLLVHGIPLECTEFAKDPHWPMSTSDIVLVVQSQVKMKLRRISLAMVRAGIEKLAEILNDQPGNFVVDAESDADLQIIAGSALSGPNCLLCGSAGLANALADVRGWRKTDRPEVTDIAPAFFICGSANSISRNQVWAYAKARGIAPILADSNRSARDLLSRVRQSWVQNNIVFLLTAEERANSTEGKKMIERIIEVSTEFIKENHIPKLYVTGGETLMALASKLSITALRPKWELEPGIVLSDAASKDMALTIISKAGGFGDSELLLRLFREN